MKKMWIGGTHYGNRGIACESWQGGGMDDAAWKQRYADRYLFIHCCQDTEDADVFHYIFKKYTSTEPLKECVMCGHSFADAGEPYGKLDVQVPPGTKAFFEEHRANLPEWAK